MHRLVETQPRNWTFVSEYPAGGDERFDSIVDDFQSGDFANATVKIRGLLLVCPDHIDAIHHLSMLLENEGKHFESYLCSREAVRISLSAVPKEFCWITNRIQWGHFCNRPFLRALHGLACVLKKQGNVHEATEIFARLVSVCPNDNLGARSVLVNCFLHLGAWEAALGLCERYRDDVDPNLAYAKVVALLELHRSEKAELELVKAIRISPAVAAELLKSKHTRPKSNNPDFISVGGADEAFSYWEDNHMYWHTKTEAYALLKRVIKLSK